MEIPGCSLCMGNQARVRPQATVISTSTRNFDDRMGDGARVYLGRPSWPPSPRSRASCRPSRSILRVMKEKLRTGEADIHRYLHFDEMGDFTLHYTGAHF